MTLEFIDIPPPKNWKTMKNHPLSELIPFGKGINMTEATGHMKKVGYRKNAPIIIYEDQRLDGRHRCKMAIDADLVPTFQRADGTEEEVREYMLEKIFRQHCDDTDKALYAAGLASAGVGRPKKDDNAMTAGEAADLLDISKREVLKAKAILKSGSESLKKAVSAGDVTLGDAEKILDAADKVQDQAVKDVKSGKTKTAAESVLAQTVFCERCQRLGKPIDNCSSCERVRERAKLRKKRKKTIVPTEHEDAFKNKIPSNLVKEWADPWIQETYDDLCGFSEEFRMAKYVSGIEKRAKYYPFFKDKDMIDAVGNVIISLDKLIQHIKEQRPAGVCPACEGKKCGKCKNSGLVPRSVYEQQIEEAKK